MAAIRGHAGMLLKTAGGGGGSTHRYWRLYITAPVSGSVLAIAEAEWRATAGGAALTVSATASSTDISGDFPSAEAADGITNDANNCWVPAVSAFPAWVSFDLGTPQTVAQVAIWPQYDGIGDSRAPLDFDVQHSDDNASWTTCDSYTGLSTGWAAGTGVGREFAVTP